VSDSKPRFDLDLAARIYVAVYGAFAGFVGRVLYEAFPEAIAIQVKGKVEFEDDFSGLVDEADPAGKLGFLLTGFQRLLSQRVTHQGKTINKQVGGIKLRFDYYFSRAIDVTPFPFLLNWKEVLWGILGQNGSKTGQGKQ
jgi:hypothetical protein